MGSLSRKIKRKSKAFNDAMAALNKQLKQAKEQLGEAEFEKAQADMTAAVKENRRKERNKRKQKV